MSVSRSPDSGPQGDAGPFGKPPPQGPASLCPRTGLRSCHLDEVRPLPDSNWNAERLGLARQTENDLPTGHTVERPRALPESGSKTYLYPPRCRGPRESIGGGQWNLGPPTAEAVRFVGHLWRIRLFGPLHPGPCGSSARGLPQFDHGSIRPDLTGGG